MVIFSLPSSVSGLAMSTSSQLLRLQANRKKRLHRLHAGRVSSLSGPQFAGTASPGMETLLSVGNVCVSDNFNQTPGCRTHQPPVLPRDYSFSLPSLGLLLTSHFSGFISTHFFWRPFKPFDSWKSTVCTWTTIKLQQNYLRQKEATIDSGYFSNTRILPW